MTLASLIALAIVASPPKIDVVYPRPAPGETLPRLDRVENNFIFGSVQPAASTLKINGTPVALRPNGAFLAWLPVDWERKTYRLSAEHEGARSDTTVRFEGRAAGPDSPPKPPDLEYPALIELASGSPLRNDPKGTYAIFPVGGTRVLATGWESGYYKIPLSPGRSVWADAKTAKPTGKDSAPASVVITRLTVDTLDGETVVTIPSNRKLLISLRDEADPDRLVVEIFGATSKIDRIWYSPEAEVVREILWEQPFDGVIRLDIRADQPLWGYYGKWDEDGYRLAFRHPPSGEGVKGLVVAVDAGHGGTQDGSIGPTRVKEKDANLRCAIRLKEILEAAGATAVMTRSSDSTLGLTERTQLAQAARADLLISLHHNALPDGVNPFGPGPFGVSAHYYRPESRDLAEAIQYEVLISFAIPDEGVYYNDLALARPSYLPAILLEAAYMMLPEQEEMISAPDYPDRLANAVVRGVERFLKARRQPPAR